MMTGREWTLAALSVSFLMALTLGTARAGIVQESVETATMARKAMEEQDWEKAHGLALSAFKLDPNAIEAVRLAYQTATRVDPAEALELASTLFQHREAKLDEKVKILTYMQLRGDHARFVKLYDLLSDFDRKNPDVIFLKSRFLAKQGVAGGARTVLEEFLKTGGNEPRFKLLLSELLIMSGDEADRRRGQQTIVELMAGKGLDARVAFNLLWDAAPGSILAELFPEDIDAFVSAFPDARPQEKLIASEIALARAKDDPAKKEGVFSEALKSHADKNLELLCSWLARMDRNDLILAVVDETKGRESVALFDHRLRALAATKGPEAAEAWLATPHPKSSELAVCLTRAKLAALRKSDADALKAWEAGFEIAKKDEKGNSFVAVYQNGLEIGQPEAAVRSALEAAKSPSSAFPSSAKLQPAFEFLYQKDRLDDLLLLTWAALARERSNLRLVNNFLYISMILNRGGNDYVAQAGKVVEALPDVAGIRATLAFAQLRNGKAAEALDTLEKVKADWSKESPAARAIRAVVLDVNGRKEEAKAEWKALEGCSLAAAEHKAFDTLLGRDG